MAQAAELLQPITDAMGRAMLSAHRVHTDDTGIPILAQGRTQKGHVWTYVADDDYVDRVASRAPPTWRTEERRGLAAPVLEAFKAWLRAEALVVLPKAPIANAIGYARNQWEALRQFTPYGRHVPGAPLHPPETGAQAELPHCALVLHGFSHQHEPFATFTGQRP